MDTGDKRSDELIRGALELEKGAGPTELQLVSILPQWDALVGRSSYTRAPRHYESPETLMLTKCS